MKLLIILCLLCFLLVQSRPTPSNFECDKECQLQYLIKYGYLQQPTTNSITDGLMDFKQGIMNLQKDAGIEETGVMTLETINLLQQPRCGMLWSHSNRQKRFTVVKGWKTPKNNKNETIVKWYLDLSNFYQIKRNNMTRQTIKNIFLTSIAKWSNTSLLSFEEVYNENEANITIKFLKGNHGDNYNFDGPGQVLAHAFYPKSGLGGDAHFDLDEDWTIWGETGISLLSVAIHELGHSLGLGHSSQKNAVMYAWYKSENIKLDEDDILGINSIYGVKPQYRFGIINPRYNRPTQKPTTTTTRQPPSTRKTTQKYKLNNFKKLFIQNSKVFVYPKSSSTLLF